MLRPHRLSEVRGPADSRDVAALLGQTTTLVPAAAEQLRLAAHNTEPRRNFIQRVAWHLDRVSPLASVFLGELVSTSLVNAGTDIDQFVAWNAAAQYGAVKRSLLGTCGDDSRAFPARNTTWSRRSSERPVSSFPTQTCATEVPLHPRWANDRKRILERRPIRSGNGTPAS